MDNDKYGRTVTMETVGPFDVYTVGGGLFTVSYVSGTPESKAYEAINGMAPSDYVPEDFSTPRYKSQMLVGADATNPLLALPLDLTTDQPGHYISGKNEIDVYMNGQRLTLDADYEEVGSAGTQQNEIQLLISVVAGDVLEFQGK